MKVYRVEYDNGRGPYNPYDADDYLYDDETGEPFTLDGDPRIESMRQALVEAHGWDDPTGRHPCPSFVMMPDCQCAFRSMRDLFAWFGGWLPQLTRIGARVVTYDIHPDAIMYEDSFQLVFSTEA